VIVIDSGSYAGGTITKSVKINVAAGIVAFSGLPITVDPGAAGTVVLRGLTLKAASAGSGAAITQASGTLFVENVVADGWYHGIYVSAGPVTRLFVKGSVIRNNTVGLEVQSGSPVKTTIDDSFFENNASVGLQLSSGIGRVSDTVVTASPTGVAVQNPGTVFTLQRCEVSGSGLDAVIVDAGGALAVSDSTLTDSETGLHNNGDGATLATFSNNVFRNNTFDIVGTYTPATLQ
jgi:hypothetical protein